MASGRVDPPPHPTVLPGAVVLVAYRPEPELFVRQLESIQWQTRGDFVCLIAADGDVDDVRGLTLDVVGNDDRFRIVGFASNVGVYRNVERALGRVPHDVGWVALSDQDDRWMPDKLERLVPLLDHASLALGQARVVEWPSGEVQRERTTRRVVPAVDLVFENRVTGSFSVFRRELLDIALPFPELKTFTRFHDHWIGVCASAIGGYVVLDEVVQDYVQHGGNLVGEQLRKPPRRPWTSVANIRRLADVYEGGHSVVQCARTHSQGSFGWRRAMTTAIVERVEAPPTGLVELADQLHPSSGIRSLARMLRDARSSPDVSGGTLEAFVAGLPYEVLDRAWLRRGRSDEHDG